MKGIKLACNIELNDNSLFYSFKQPTPCHYFIRMLAEKGILLRHFTQVSTVVEFEEFLIVSSHGTLAYDMFLI